MDYIRWIRAHVGKQRILIVFSSIVLRDDHGHILLQRRTDLDVWGLPGGVMEIGENILTCAHRELEEETGLTADELSLVGVYTDPKYQSIYPNGDQVQQFTICLQGNVAGGQFRVDGIENSEQRFFPIHELPWDEIPLWYTDMLREAITGGPPAFRPPFTRTVTQPQWEQIRPYIGHARFIAVGATAVTTRGDGRILVMQRQGDGQWGIPGGHTELGENVAYTAVRETREETGMVVRTERILGVYSDPTPWIYPHGDEIQFVSVMFHCRWTGETALFDPGETRQVAWVTPDEFLSLENGPILNKIHRFALDHLDHGYFVV